MFKALPFFSPAALARTTHEVIRWRDPCRYCGSRQFIVEPGKAHHHTHLRCVQCRRGGRWVSEQQWKAINRRIER